MRDRNNVTTSAQLLPYGVALLSTTLALGISLPLEPWIKPTPISPFFAALMVSAWYGGLGPGLVATVLSTLAINYCFVPPYYAWKFTEPGNIIRLSVFVMAALLISGLNESRRIALHREQTLRVASEAIQSEAQAAKERLETFLSSINDGFYVLDRNWCYTYVNDRYCEIAGMQREVLLGQNIWELFSDTVDTDFYVQFQQALSEQTPLQFEYLYTTWNRWFEYRVYPSSSGLTIFVVEITDRKRTEKALQASEERFRLVTQAVNGLVFDWNLQTDEVYRSEQLYEIIGVYPEDVPPTLTWWHERIHPDDLARLQPQAAQAFTGSNNLYESEYQVRHKDGHWIDVWERGCLIRDDHGQVIRVVGSTVDISERKETESALQESERRFRRLVESNMFGVAFGNFTGSIHYANDYFLKMVGYSREEIESGRVQWMAITPTEFLPLDEKAAAELRNNGVATPFEKEYIRKDGTRVPILIGAALLQEPYDQQPEIIGFFIDLTERKQAEAERNQLLLQEQAAREAAESANRIKDEFLAVLSHELRSPLNPILGWAKLLQNGKLDEARTKQAIATIERNAKLQAELIEDLLDVSRILRGKLSLTVSPVNLASTIRAAIETVRLAAEAKSIRIEATLDAEVGQVLGDSTRLQQVAWNLLSNAVKFTPPRGRVEVKLSLASEYSSLTDEQPRANDQGQMIHDKFAQITVSDTGKGIAPDFLPYVFDYFRQADSATTRKFGGLGLGLAIVRHLVELHGGMVQVDSPGEGLGATFTVRLPLMPIQPTINQDAQLSESPLDLSGVQVLVVDDDTDSREFIAFLLKQAGAKVIATSCAHEAFTALTQSQPDVLVSDIGMPQMDGYMLMRQVRALPPEQGGEIPAIALTAYAGELDHQQALSVGFQKHIPKPVEPEELVRAIASLLKQSTAS